MPLYYFMLFFLGWLPATLSDVEACPLLSYMWCPWRMSIGQGRSNKYAGSVDLGVLIHVFNLIVNVAEEGGCFEVLSSMGILWCMLEFTTWRPLLAAMIYCWVGSHSSSRWRLLFNFQRGGHSRDSRRHPMAFPLPSGFVPCKKDGPRSTSYCCGGEEGPKDLIAFSIYYLLSFH